MGILMVSVVPKVTSIFADTGQALPWNTQVLIFVSRLIRGYWWTLDPRSSRGRGVSSLEARRPAGARACDRAILKLPVFGLLARQIAITRFAKTLSTMLASGVPLLRRSTS